MLEAAIAVGEKTHMFSNSTQIGYGIQATIGIKGPICAKKTFPTPPLHQPELIELYDTRQV